jgi:hypothetical protein
MQVEHVHKRETFIGRWMPVAFYAVNVILWLDTGIRAGVWELLWLAVVTLPAVGLYLWRTR